ncbi:MAG: sterol desaturase/sphingolipid hydroxylase (fatty acid hydroxylase superfamily) [Myxococcota bacterium]|jgi:sterol desaturase/sphingolipid hydroxylase (fatty acid hydroxylase superfamily)
MEETLILLALPVFIVTIIAEWRRTLQPGARGHYLLPDTAASLAMGAGYLIIQGLFKAAPIALYGWLYQHRLFDIEMGLLGCLALLLLDDLTYYVFHRAHHEVRLLWAVHVNHHSSELYNLSTALRQPWLEPFVGPLFWTPLVLLGFPVEAVVLQQVISLLYQYWIHTEQVDRLPVWFEQIFNTPSHHRVHHGSNPEYLDRNYGGILIIWDRLFGSFEPEVAPVVYGLTKNVSSYNPVRIVSHELVAIAHDVARSQSLGEGLHRVFGSPASQQ